MPDSFSVANDSIEDAVAEVVDAFRESVRRGEHPDVEEYALRHPHLADILRRVLPALELLRPQEPSQPSFSAAEGLPVALGDFRLVREVGKGGMGIVYEAEQLSLRRRVALKVLPFASTLDPRHLQRFHNEAQAAACLHHTNIVPVHFVGCERGVHFYAMQFIDGQPLSEIIRQLRRAEKPESFAGKQQAAAYPQSPESASQTSPTTRPVAEVTPLTSEGRRGRDYYRRAAELIVQAAEALDHAHQLGIVHRDVKPANLLLDARGNLWITDFGLAQVQSETRLTLTGDVVGTLRYMSPEQALAKRFVLDHRTDVYSLGVTLYELLTLRPAFPSEDRQELLRQIAFEEPAKPRRLERTIPEVLETIVLKAMEKQPQDRYATAQEMADDLRHWLDNRPIRARRSSSWARLSKWIRRRPALAGLVAVSTLSILGLVIGLLWHNMRLRESAERERRLSGKASRQREAARGAVNDMYTEVAEKWLSGEPRMSNVQRAFLEKALQFYEELAREEEEGPEQLLERAKANRRSGAILAKLEQRTEAEAAYRQAIALLESGDVPGKAAELAQDYTALGAFLGGTQRNAEAEAAYQRAKTLWESIPSDEAAQPEVRYGWATTLSNLAGLLLMYAKRDGDGKSLVQQGLPIIRGLVAEFPQEARYHGLLGAMLNHNGIATSRLGDAARACEYMNEAIARQAEAVKLDPRQPKYRLFLRNHYAVLAVYGLLPLKRYSEATDAARKALDVAERLAADFPDVPHYQRVLADAYCDLGDVLNRSNHAPEAEQAISKACKIQERAVAADPNSPSDRMLAGAMYNELALLRRNIGRYRDAVRAYRKTLEFAPKDFSANNNLVWLLALGAEQDFNDPAELVRLARTATEANPQQEHCWVTLGLAHYRSGDWTAAKAALEKKPSKLSPAKEGMRNVVLAMTESRLGNKTAARTAYDRAVELLGQPKLEPGVIDDRCLQAEAAQLLGITVPATKP